MERLESAPPTRRTRSGGDGGTIPEMTGAAALVVEDPGLETGWQCIVGSLTSESVEKGCAGGGS